MPKNRTNKLPFTVTQGQSANCVIVSTATTGADWEQWFLLRSDAHHDNPDCKQDLEEFHLKQAIERNAGVLDFGDLFCAMQGKWDRRKNKSKVREEHQVDNYLDALVSTAADFYEPYAANWVVQGIGNHETAIRKNHETCLTDRFCQTLRDRTGAAVLKGGYTGWVIFRFTLGGTQKESRRLWYTHGYGGGGPVTKDMIQRSRQLAYVDNADIMCSGHTHDQWVTKDMRVRVNDAGQVLQRPVVYVKCPTYKDEWKTGEGGWVMEKGMPPKPLGAFWLRFYRGTESRAGNRKRPVVKFEIREAET